MEDTSRKRWEKLQNLNNYVQVIDKKMDNIIISVGWTFESTKSPTKVFECPFNSSHHISEEKLKKHLEYCQWKAEGYQEWDIPLSEPAISSDLHSSIKFDEQILGKVLQQCKSTIPAMQISQDNRLIPRTSNRIFSDLTSDERKTVYEYVIINTTKPNVGEDISSLNKFKEDNNQLSYLELLAHERDLKRRRAKHRGVHTNKKSHIEILREIINQQMETLNEYCNVKTNISNQMVNALHKNEETYCISNTSKEIYHNKNEITLKDNSNKRNSEENGNYYEKCNDATSTHDYYKKKHYSCNSKEKKLPTNYQNYHEDSKCFYKSLKKHNINQEYSTKDKEKQFYRRSSECGSNKEKNDDKPDKHGNKSRKYDRIHKYNKLYHINLTKTKQRCKTSTNKRH